MPAVSEDSEAYNNGGGSFYSALIGFGLEPAQPRTSGPNATSPHQIHRSEQFLSTTVRACCALQYDWKIMTAPTSMGWIGERGPRSGPGPTLTDTQDRLRSYKKPDFNNIALLFRGRNAQLIHCLFIPDRVAFNQPSAVASVDCAVEARGEVCFIEVANSDCRELGHVERGNNSISILICSRDSFTFPLTTCSSANSGNGKLSGIGSAFGSSCTLKFSELAKLGSLVFIWSFPSPTAYSAYFSQSFMDEMI